MSNQRETESSQDFVEETINRNALLTLLADEPRKARSMADQLGTSRSTVHRATDRLGDLGLIEKSGETFEVTGLGLAVAEEIGELKTTLETANRLEPFLNTVDVSTIDVPLEEFDDATITAPRHRQAHVGVNRIIELIEQTSSLRMFSSIISPLYVDVAHREILGGTDIEVVFDREVLELIVNKYGEEARDAFETGRFHVLVADDVPFELFLFDDRMGMAAHDSSGIARAFVESTSAGAREWARELYERYVDDALRFDPS